MASKIKVDQIEGSSGSTITIPTGQSLILTDGLPSSSLPTVPVTKGGTGLTTLGSAGQALLVNSGGTAFEFGEAGGGKLLQVVSAVNTTGSSTTSTSFVSNTTPISVSITPSSASSKIFVMAFVACYAGTQDYYVGTSLFRGGTNLFTQTLGTPVHTRVQTGGNHFATHPLMFLDSPSTTSATTYEVKYRSENTSYTVQVNANNTASVITAMEIGA